VVIQGGWERYLYAVGGGDAGGGDKGLREISGWMRVKWVGSWGVGGLRRWDGRDGMKKEEGED